MLYTTGESLNIFYFPLLLAHLIEGIHSSGWRIGPKKQKFAAKKEVSLES